MTSTISELLTSLGAGPTPHGEGAYLVTPMDCERCGSEHATIHLFEASGGAERERHLCKRCGQFAAALLDAPFQGWPETSLEPKQVCPECGEIRFDYVKAGAQIRCNIQSAGLPIRILIRGCAWAPL